MKETEIARLFDSLPVPQPGSISSCSFTALPLAAGSGHKLGKDEGGGPCLLIATGTATKTQSRVPLVLENLAVLFDLLCQISSPIAPTQTGTFTVLKCVAADSAVRSYFLSLLPGISAAIGRTNERSKVAAVIEDLVELFRALGAPPKNEIQGLWGELLGIHEARDPLTLASAWRCQSGDCYDFNIGAERIEVKTTSQSPRRHHFSLDQLCPPAGTRLIVASIVIQRSGAGLSVFDLMDTVRKKTPREPQLHLRMTRQLHDTLGDSWQSARNVRFDYEAAVESLRYYEGSQIPKISPPLPEGVSEVSFVVDFQGMTPLILKSLTNTDVLLRALFSTKRRE